jgi:hypothetical protein
MSMPKRIMVTYQRDPEEIVGGRRGEIPETVLMKVFESLSYDLYMTHDRTNQETGMPERTLEFWEKF